MEGHLDFSPSATSMDSLVEGFAVRTAQEPQPEVYDTRDEFPQLLPQKRYFYV